MRIRPLPAMLLLVLLALPVVRADPVGASPIIVTPSDDLAHSIALRETTSYTFLLYNNGTTPHLVVAEMVEDPGSFVASVEPVSVVLRPGEDRTIVLTATSPRYSEAATLFLNLTLRATDLATGAQASATFLTVTELTGVAALGDPEGKIFGQFENFLPAPLDDNFGAFLITVLLWALIAASLILVIDPILRSLARRTKTDVDDILLKILRGPVFVIVVFFGTINSLGIIGLPLEWRELLRNVYGFVTILVATWVGYRVFKDLLLHYGRRLAARTTSGLDDRLIPALDKIGGAIILVIGAFASISYLGFDITLFLAGFGVAGLIIAFAAQETLSNFFASLHLMLDRPFKVGDLIELEAGMVCEVKDIGFRSTKLYWGKHHDVIIMPNKDLAGRRIINLVRPDLRYKTIVSVGVSYDADIDAVKQILREIAAKNPHVLQEKGYEPLFRLNAFGDSAVEISLIVWVDNVYNHWQVASDLREEIKKRFAAAGVEIPYPQRVVHTRQAPAK